MRFAVAVRERERDCTPTSECYTRAVARERSLSETRRRHELGMEWTASEGRFTCRHDVSKSCKTRFA